MPSAEEVAANMPAIPEGEFAVHGTVTADPQHADALAGVYAQTTKNAASEAGTLYYCISRDPKDPTKFHFFERYSGAAAFMEHNSQPIIQKLMADQWIKGVEVAFAEPIKPSA